MFIFGNRSFLCRHVWYKKPVPANVVDLWCQFLKRVPWVLQHLISDRLHWLPVHKRVQFKLCLLAYKAVHGLAPHYLADMCRPVSSVDARQRLRSTAREDLVILRTAMKFGARSFAVAAPSEWNRLPLHIRSKQSVNCFKVALRSFLFTTDSS